MPVRQYISLALDARGKAVLTAPTLDAVFDESNAQSKFTASLLSLKRIKPAVYHNVTVLFGIILGHKRNNKNFTQCR